MTALDGINLDIQGGSIFGILGRSGAGKTTLIRCLNRLETPSTGRILVGDVDLASLPPDELRRQRRRIGMVFQHFHLLHSRTAADNIAAPLEIAGVPKPQRKRRVAELLDLVGLSDRGNAYPSQLSGGQKQRVGIARALAADPDVLLSDEATSALDSETTAQILDLLRDVNRRLGVTIVLITHELSLVKSICDGAALLEGGRLVESGALSDLVTDPSSRLGQWLLPALPEVPSDGRHLELRYEGRGGDTILSDLTLHLGQSPALLGGGVEQVAGTSVGRLLIRLPHDADLDSVFAFLGTRDVRVMVR
ncbi:methionine ABC transporter ATP-binding protein [Niveispirillum sp. BGYR6]|uniref:methionine ABC transporter ATP-binding protein n=1 Tax=Niveispirillum sp. BGYR6 TaxID=2971249 RepID=UPI00325FD2F6